MHPIGGRVRPSRAAGGPAAGVCGRRARLPRRADGVGRRAVRAHPARYRADPSGGRSADGAPRAERERQHRLRGDLPERLKQLEGIEHNDAFDRLPPKTRAAVEQSAAEVASYIKTRQRFHAQVKPPFQAKNEAEFDRYEKQAKEFRLPSAYAEAWAGTSIAGQVERIRGEYASVRAAIDDELAWIGKQIGDGERLYRDGNLLPSELADPAKRKEGRQKAGAWFAAYLKYSNRPYTRYPGDQPIRGTLAFTYGELRKFHAIRDARQQWDRVRGKLDETYQYVSKLMTK